MNYEYKGVKIEFREGTGKFSAIIDGKSVIASSLDAIKTRINKIEADTFEQFDCIQIENADYRSDKYKINSFTVTGLGRSKSRHNHSVHFIVNRQEGYYQWTPTEVILDTPENRVIAEKIIAHRTETARIETERSKQLVALEEKLVKRSANPK